MSQLPQLDVYIPPSFAYFVKRLSGVSTSTVRMTVLSNTTASAGSTIKVKFPSNAIVNMSSFTMYSLGYTTATAGFASFPKLSQSMINQLRVSIGGQIVSGGNLQEMGTFYNIASRLQQGEAQVKMLNLQHLGHDVVTPTALIAQAASIPIVIDDFGGFLACTPTYVHTGIMPEIIVDLVLAGTNVLAISHGATGVAYHLENIYFTIEVVQFDNDVYSKILSSRLSAGQTIEIPFLDCHYVLKPASTIIETQVSSNAISKVFVVPRTVGYGAPDEPYYGLTRPFIFSTNATGRPQLTPAAVFRDSACTAYWSVDNKMYPSTPATAPELYQMTIDAFGDRASTSAVNSLLLEPTFSIVVPFNLAEDHKKRIVVAETVTALGATTEAELLPEMSSFLYAVHWDPVSMYLDRNAIFCLNLEVNEGANERLISGYSSIGKNAVIRFDGTNLLGPVDLTMFVVVKRCLKIRDGQQILIDL